MRIDALPDHERPRERLQRLGAAALADAELLAVVLRCGSRGQNALVLAQGLLAEHNGLQGLLAAARSERIRARGMGVVKRGQLLAAFELSRRCLEEQLRDRDQIRDPASCAAYLQARLCALPHEAFSVLFLDQRHRLIGCEEMFRGTLASSSVHPREVLRRALELQAAAVIVAHNHPSGASEPSAADIELTASLKAALGLVDIRLLDHFIIGQGTPLSMAQHGLV